MPRTGIKPFFRKQTRSYYCQIDGKQIGLGPDKRAADAKCQRLLDDRAALKAAVTTLRELFARYLEWCQEHRSGSTYYSAQFYLRSFAKTLPAKMRVEEVRPKHVMDWVNGVDTWNSSSKHDAVTIVQRSFSWAVGEHLLEHHPLQRIEGKPSRQRRETYYSPQTWEQVIAAVQDQTFLDLVVFLYETGCRPLEARSLEARHVDIANRLVVFPTEESKGKHSQRMIVLNDVATEILERLCVENPRGAAFRNERGNAWTRDAIGNRFMRLRLKTGIDDLCAYGIRHTYATNGLMNGVDSVTLATLMGHKDPTMIARTYQHLAKNLGFLRDAAERARGQDASRPAN